MKSIISLPPCSLRNEKHINIAYLKAFKTDRGPPAVLVAHAVVIVAEEEE